mgnify:FL=1
MSLQPMIPVLMALLAATAGCMTWAASVNAQAVSILAASAFALVLVAIAWRINDLGRWPREKLADTEAPVHAARRDARLIGLVYAWGRVTLLAVYSLSGLRWQHGWQYGSGMTLIAALLLLLVHKLGDAGFPMRTAKGLNMLNGVTLAHAAAAAGGLVFLVSAGKLWAGKQDWAANHVFLVGGLAVIALSLIAWRTHGEITTRQQSA